MSQHRTRIRTNHKGEQAKDVAWALEIDRREHRNMKVRIPCSDGSVVSSVSHGYCCTTCPYSNGHMYLFAI